MTQSELPIRTYVRRNGRITPAQERAKVERPRKQDDARGEAHASQTRPARTREAITKPGRSEQCKRVQALIVAGQRIPLRATSNKLWCEHVRTGRAEAHCQQAVQGAQGHEDTRPQSQRSGRRRNHVRSIFNAQHSTRPLAVACVRHAAGRPRAPAAAAQAAVSVDRNLRIAFCSIWRIRSAET